MEYLGNQELLKLKKTAFLASSTIPLDMVLKCYDWAASQGTGDRQSRATALARNRYICELADGILFVGVTEQSSLCGLKKEFDDKRDKRQTC